MHVRSRVGFFAFSTSPVFGDSQSWRQHLRNEGSLDVVHGDTNMRRAARSPGNSVRARSTVYGVHGTLHRLVHAFSNQRRRDVMKWQPCLWCSLSKGQ